MYQSQGARADRVVLQYLVFPTFLSYYSQCWLSSWNCHAGPRWLLKLWPSQLSPRQEAAGGKKGENQMLLVWVSHLSKCVPQVPSKHCNMPLLGHPVHKRGRKYKLAAGHIITSNKWRSVSLKKKKGYSLFKNQSSQAQREEDRFSPGLAEDGPMDVRKAIPLHREHRGRFGRADGRKGCPGKGVTSWLLFPWTERKATHGFRL